MHNLSFQRYRWFFSILACVLFIAGVGRYFSEWPRFWDIWLWDETFYMGSGIYTWSASSLSNYEASPLYSYVYRFVHRFVQLPVDLFATVGLMGTAGAVLATTGASWVLGRNVLLSACTGAILVMGNFPMSGPRLIYAAIIVLVVGSSVGLSLRVFAARATVLALTTFIAAFIRPEFALAFYLFLLLTIGGWMKVAFSRKDRQALWLDHRQDFFVAVLAFLALVVLSKVWSFPVIRGGARALMAFGQHYSLYWTTVNHVDINAFHNWEAVLARALPGVQSEFQAIIKYPGQMLAFFAFNVLSAFQLLGRAISVFVTTNYIFFVALGAGILGIYFARRKLGARVAVMSPHELAPWWHDALLWLVLSAPCLISVVLIYARDHYLVILTAIIVLGLALIVRRKPVEDSPMLAAGVSATFLLLVVPVTPVPRPNLELVSVLKTQGNLGRVLEADGGWCFYVPEKCVSRFILDIPKGRNFLANLDEDRIDSVIVSRSLRDYAEVNGQKDFVAFLDEPEKRNWKRIPLGPDVYLLKRESGPEPSGGGMLAADMMQYVSKVALGNEFGAFNDKGDMTFFVHPGRDTPTSFELQLGKMAQLTECRTVSLVGKMDANVPQEAVDRGAAKVGMEVRRKGGSVFNAEVSVPQSQTFEFSPDRGENVVVIVDKLGNPDTDWFNLQIRLSNCGGVVPNE